MPNHKIAIDLGITTSRVAVYKEKKVEIITNEYESRQTPSYVSFNEGEILIGEEAKSNGYQDPENTIYGVKHLIGSFFDEKLPQFVNKEWLFTIISNEKNFRKISITVDNCNQTFAPEEIIIKILSKLKETATGFLQDKVKDAVVIVPSFFNFNQRQAIVFACSEVGLPHTKLLNESVAVSVAYIHQRQNIRGNVLVFSLGGGPFDISVLFIDETGIHVKSTYENSQIGGENFTNSLVEYFVKSFQEKHHINLKTNKHAIWRLEEECEKLKKKLSFSPKISFNVHAIINGIGINETITREMYNSLIESNVHSIKTAIDEVLVSIEMSKSNINHVIMAGGSARMPQIQELLKKVFGEEKICEFPNPDEAAISGAAIYAAKKILVSDVLSHPLNYYVNDDGPPQIIYPKNSPVDNLTIDIPSDVQTLSIYEGQKNFPIFVGECDLMTTTSSEFTCKVKFSINNNRIIHATALWEHIMQPKDDKKLNKSK